MKLVTIIIQTKSGIRIRVIPWQRIETAVVITLIEETVVPMPVNSKLKIH